MTTNIDHSLETLPVELLHRIFDNLNADTLLISLQYVCKRLNLVINNYNRYKLNFKSISKYEFHQLSHGAHPKNVISLILSNENQTCGQIELFLSLYPIENYTRLQSITLISIEEPYVKHILQHLSNTCLLTSLIIHCNSNSNLDIESLQFISLIIRKNNFRKLDLTIGYDEIDKLEWPIQCSIQNLRLFDSIQFNKFSTILRCSPYLKTIILQDCLLDNIQELNSTISNNISYPQLTSLTLEDCILEMTMIELLLSLTPSLIHLIIKGNGAEFFDGARWERLFQIKLPKLNKFEFAFQNNIGINCDMVDFESIMAPFQTKFWLDIKHWYITVVGVKNSPFINLYSIPDCAPKITFHPKANKISCSTVPSINNNLITMNSVRELSLDLIEMQADMIEKEEISIQRLFNRVIKLIVRLNGDWPNSTLDLLSSLTDLSTISEIELSIDFTRGNVLKTTAGIVALLEKTTNIRSLIIPFRIAMVQTICPIVSERVQHLQIVVQSVEDMKIILKQFTHLSSMTFKFSQYSTAISVAEIVEWLTAAARDFTYQSTKGSVSFWLGKKTKEYT